LISDALGRLIGERPTRSVLATAARVGGDDRVGIDPGAVGVEVASACWISSIQATSFRLQVVQAVVILTISGLDMGARR